LRDEDSLRRCPEVKSLGPFQMGKSCEIWNLPKTKMKTLSRREKILLSSFLLGARREEGSLALWEESLGLFLWGTKEASFGLCGLLGKKGVSFGLCYWVKREASFGLFRCWKKRGANFGLFRRAKKEVSFGLSAMTEKSFGLFQEMKEVSFGLLTKRGKSFGLFQAAKIEESLALLCFPMSSPVNID